MLERALAAGQSSEASVADVVYYTEMLARNQTPEAQLMARALDAVRGSRAPGEIRAIASRAVASTKLYEAQKAARSASKKGRLPEAVVRAAREGEPPARDERLAAGLRRLRALADG